MIQGQQCYRNKRTMALISSVVWWLFMKYCSCQSPCMEEPIDGKQFSFSVKEHIAEESYMCIWIPYNLTVTANLIPYNEIWFEGNPSNMKDMRAVTRFRSETRDSYMISGLPPGEYEYGFKLEWGCNQTYVFPNRVKISVSALTLKPKIQVPPLIEGRRTTIYCQAPQLCTGRARTYWKWQKIDRPLIDIDEMDFSFFRRPYQRAVIFPTADDHNTTLSCVAEYDHHVTNNTVTLNVHFPPKIQRNSQCLVEGKHLVCVCVSRGNPLPPITWPLVNLTDYSVRSFSSSQTVNSTLTLLVADYPSNTMTCVSSNELGQEELEIPFEILTNGFRMADLLDCSRKVDAVLPWITAMCFILNVVLITTLVVYIFKQRKIKKRECGQTMDLYASLRKTDVDQEYSVICPQSR